MACFVFGLSKPVALDEFHEWRLLDDAVVVF